MTDHPLTETAAEITDEMVEAGASYAWKEANPGTLGWDSLSERHKEGCRRDARAVLTAALAVVPNEDDRSWEPLTEKRQVRSGDEVRQDRGGVITTAVADDVDSCGNLYTSEGYLIGRLDIGTWYRLATPAPELPTQNHSVIVTAEGHDRGTATRGGITYYAREAQLLGDVWYAAWRKEDGTPGPAGLHTQYLHSETWKKEDQ